MLHDISQNLLSVEDAKAWLSHVIAEQLGPACKLVIDCPLPADCCAIACRAMDGAIGRTLQIDSTP